MIKILLDDIAIATKGNLKNNENFYIEGVSIDSRENLNKKLFVPILGKNNDGHDYIKNAFKNGAVCTLTEKDINIDKPYILVKSTRQALKDLANYYISLFKIKKIAITGSSGKTTTKDIIASMLSQKYKVLKTEGNFNNEIGLPLTIFNLDETIEIAVFEMGMNNFLEIHNLSKIVKPDICIITNIGVSHIENLGSKEGILKAKCEIFDYMKKDGIVVLNYDDEMLLNLKNKFKNIYFYSLNNKLCLDKFSYADNVVYNDINSTTFDIISQDEKFKVEILFSGKYMIYNVLAAFVVSKILNINKEEMKYALKNFKLSKNRMEILNNNIFRIINDVYNSNPIALKECIDMISISKTRKVCIIGDMLELGEYSNKMHFDLGKYIVNKKIDLIICIGKNSYNMYLGALEEIEKNNYKGINTLYYKTKEEFLKQKYDLFKHKDTVLVKASRGMKFECIVESLMRWKNE